MNSAVLIGTGNASLSVPFVCNGASKTLGMANILVVEDNDDVREMMAVTLELEGHEVATAVNGRDALNKLHSGEKPCLILLDLMMPVMNGWEFQTELEHDPDLRDVPVVVVSALGGEMARRRAATAYLPKPIDMDQLLHVVCDFCNGSHERPVS